MYIGDKHYLFEMLSNIAKDVFGSNSIRLIHQNTALPIGRFDLYANDVLFYWRTLLVESWQSKKIIICIIVDYLKSNKAIAKVRIKNIHNLITLVFSKSYVLIVVDMQAFFFIRIITGNNFWKRMSRKPFQNHLFSNLYVKKIMTLEQADRKSVV